MARRQCCRETETAIFAARTNLPVLDFLTWQVCSHMVTKELSQDSQRCVIPVCDDEWMTGDLTMTTVASGLDIGYVPAGPHAFLRLSGQFGPLQLIFHWPEGPVDFLFFF